MNSCANVAKEEKNILKYEISISKINHLFSKLNHFPFTQEKELTVLRDKLNFKIKAGNKSYQVS